MTEASRAFSNRVMGLLRAGEITLAIAETRHVMGMPDPEIVVHWTYVIAATPSGGAGTLRQLAAAITHNGAQNRLRALACVIGLYRAIAAESWNRACAEAEKIRYYAPDTSRAALVGVLAHLARNDAGNPKSADWLMDSLDALVWRSK